jgi:Domain of unknown function (DUF4123)
MPCACDPIGLASGAGMTEKHLLIDAPTAYLFDAGGLLADEVDRLRRSPSVLWLYEHTGDARAEALGPVMVAATPDVVAVGASVSQDADRNWAISALCAQESFERLGRHIRTLRQIHTQDGQRYYWRFADSRCLTAMWKQLDKRQQLGVLGPINRWQFHARNGRPVDLGSPINHVLQSAGIAQGALRLSDQQLSGLLDAVWPDQLLASVVEQHPGALNHLNPFDRHVHAQAVCDWLREAGEERYPVQQSLMLEVLSVAQPNWDTTQLHEVLARARQGT